MSKRPLSLGVSVSRTNPVCLMRFSEITFVLLYLYMLALSDSVQRFEIKCCAEHGFLRFVSQIVGQTFSLQRRCSVTILRANSFFLFSQNNANLVCKKIKRKNLSLSPCFKFDLVCRLIFGACVRSVVCLQYGCRLRAIQRNRLL